MKHNKHSLSFLLACFATAASLAGCTWDSSLYDDFVNKNTDSVMACYGYCDITEEITEDQCNAAREAGATATWKDGKCQINVNVLTEEQCKQITNKYYRRLGITLPNGVYAYKDPYITTTDVYYCGTYDDVGTLTPENTIQDIKCDEIIDKLDFPSFEDFKIYFKRMTRIPAEASPTLCPYNTESCGPLMVRISGQNGSLPSLEPITFCNECKEHSVKCRVGEKIDCIDIRSNQHCGSCDNDCTKTNQICKLEGNNYKCVAPDCPLGQHYGENGCEDDDINACGSKNEDCTKKYNELGWKNENSGYCGIIIENTNTSESLTCTKEQSNAIRKCVKEITSDPNYDVNEKEEEIKKCFLKYYPSGTTMVAACLATDCLSTHHLEGGKCVPNFGCESSDEYYYDGECIENTLANCGKHNNNCQNITGWSNECPDDTYDDRINACGACIEGICVPSECQTGYHLDKDNNGKDICVADDSNNCGGVGDKYKCGLGQVCTEGECKDNCGGGEVRCENGGVISCADPMTSTTFCGADDACSDGSYTPCKEGQACIGGECKQNSCTGDMTLCVVNGENKCINVTSDDPNHCGACNLKCSDRSMPNASSTTCSNGQCQYRCDMGYTNCGINTVPNCIKKENLNNDPNNCGSCGKRCQSDELCSNGSCKKSTCTNQCLSNGTCVNTNDKCGTQCINCSSANNAASGTCNAGNCTITSCMTGFHLTTAKTCALNTPTSCGSTNKADAVNCKTHNHASDGYCENGQCVATSCETGYHVVEGVCVEDSPTACGASATNCNALVGWKEGECKSGQCEANACQSGFCLNGTICVDGKDNASMCGINGTECNDCDDNYFTDANLESTACSAGQCIIDTCISGYHVFENKLSCKEDSPEACGQPPQNCPELPGWKEADCQEGKCVALSCEDTHFLQGDQCMPDPDIFCGDRNCTQIKHVEKAFCKAKTNVCHVEKCKDGYTPNNQDNDHGTCDCHYSVCNITTFAHATAATCETNDDTSELICKITCPIDYPLNESQDACECNETSCQNYIPSNSHIKTRACQANECVIASCETYYKENNDLTACVCDPNSCMKTKIKNATTAQCSDNECKIECLPGHSYNKESGACECSGTSCNSTVNTTCNSDKTCCRANDSSDPKITSEPTCCNNNCLKKTSEGQTFYQCSNTTSLSEGWKSCKSNG